MDDLEFVASLDDVILFSSGNIIEDSQFWFFELHCYI